MPIVITADNFKNEVLESDKPVLIDFWASWCGPCRMLSPVVDEIASEHPEVKVGKVNVDEQPELAMAFRAERIPMLVLVKDGVVHKQEVGFRTKEAVYDMIGIYPDMK